MTIRSLLRSHVITFACSIALSGLVGSCMVGCGKQSSSGVAETGSAVDRSGSAFAVSANSTLGAETVPPTDVVSQFLDLIRRGGSDSGASTLLTAKAQSELTRIGRTVQPIGSPNAKFVVTRSELLPENPNASLVHSVWQEPKDDNASATSSSATANSGAVNSGAVLEYQVVWALQKESNQWRISGLAMEIDPGQNPLIVNFEDGNRMALLLADADSGAGNSKTSNQFGDSDSDSEGSSSPSASNAAAQDPTLNR